MDPFLKTVLELTYDVYNSLGSGYNEVVYHRALEVAFRLNGINYQSEVVVPVTYKGFYVGHSRIDLLLNNSFIVELKAVAHLNNDCIIQIKNYMKHCNITEGLIINFSQKLNSIDIRYLKGDNIFTFENGIFTEI
jgi:GxxExxY protein